MARAIANAGLAVLLSLTSAAAPAWRDPSPHHIRFVKLEDGVRLEVLDWGGRGAPLVLLAGGGNTAHVFDDFAPKLTADRHVYGITRRGFGASGFAPAANPANRLRDDVLSVIDALKLTRPILAGHSIAGAELSAAAAARPDRIAGLVYLEAGYPYAFDNGEGPAVTEFLKPGPRAPDPLAANLASFASLQAWDASVFGFRMPESEFRQTWRADHSDKPEQLRDFPGAQFFAAILANPIKYSRLPAPALAIFASPHVPERWIADSSAGVRDSAKIYYAAVDAATERQAQTLESAVPTPRVVRLRASHYIFLSNEAEILSEMRGFFRMLQ